MGKCETRSEKVLWRQPRGRHVCDACYVGYLAAKLPVPSSRFGFLLLCRLSISTPAQACIHSSGPEAGRPAAMPSDGDPAAAASASSSATLAASQRAAAAPGSASARCGSSSGGAAATAADQSEQPLQTPWTFWFDRVSSVAYSDALQRLGTVHTVQGFWRYYCNLTRPGQLQAGDNYHFFRGALQPAQETLPGGGCWVYRLDRSGSSERRQTSDAEVNRLWEKLLLSLVGETVGEPCVVGAGVSVRANQCVLSIWCRDDSDASAHQRVGSVLESSVFDDGDATAQLRWLSTRRPPPPAPSS